MDLLKTAEAENNIKSHKFPFDHTYLLRVISTQDSVVTPQIARDNRMLTLKDFFPGIDLQEYFLLINQNSKTFLEILQKRNDEVRNTYFDKSSEDPEKIPNENALARIKNILKGNNKINPKTLLGIIEKLADLAYMEYVLQIGARILSLLSERFKDLDIDRLILYQASDDINNTGASFVPLGDLHFIRTRIPMFTYSFLEGMNYDIHRDIYAAVHELSHFLLHLYINIHSLEEASMKYLILQESFAFLFEEFMASLEIESFKKYFLDREDKFKSKGHDTEHTIARELVALIRAIDAKFTANKLIDFVAWLHDQDPKAFLKKDDEIGSFFRDHMNTLLHKYKEFFETSE